MAFNSAPGRAEYTAIASQTVFPFTFKIYLDGDIKVYKTLAGATPDDTADLLTITTDYTVTIDGDNGGNVTLVIGAAVGDTITLVRDLDVNRLIEYQNNGDLLAETLNQDQNYQTYLIADKDAENTRFLRLPDSAQNVDTNLPAPEALNFLQWNTSATALINVNSLQADGFIWTAADVYTKTEVYNKTETDNLLSGKASVNIEKIDKNIVHDITVDADYTLTADQNLYGRVEIIDTGTTLTGAINIITDNIEHTFLFVNSTLQTLTVKTSAGTGIAVAAGQVQEVRNDTVNVVAYEGAASASVVLQTAYAELTTTGTSTAVIPADATIPQQTEGVEILTASITPTRADSFLLINVNCYAGENTNTGTHVLGALFRDATANAIASRIASTDDNAAITSGLLNMQIRVPSNAVALTTFKLRVGTDTGTVRWNGHSGTQYGGASAMTTISIMEVL